ncbi:MAG: porin [Gammaproteobacteria bacterium]|nr:porin [Gammaproteobacteria bacterium]
MKKTLLALAVAGVVAAPAAMAEVTVYGLAHVSVDNTSGDLAGAVFGTAGEQSVAVTSRASRVGVKAAEDLGGGLKAIAQLEWEVDMDDNDGAGQNIKSRNQIVGLAGGFGTVAIGRHDTPYKMSTGKLDVFSDTAADYNAVIGATQLENRANNAIAYLSPDFNGLSFQAAIVAAEAADASGDDANAADAISVAVQYNAGPLFVAVAHESFEDEAAGGGAKGQSGTRVGVGYDAGVAKIGFVYETASDVEHNNATIRGLAQADDDYDAWLINAAIPVGGNNAVIAEYGVGELDKSNAEVTVMAVGVAHNFSKTSSAYVAYGNVDVEVGSAVDDDAQILTAGLVVKF